MWFVQSFDWAKMRCGCVWGWKWPLLMALSGCLTHLVEVEDEWWGDGFVLSRGWMDQSIWTSYVGEKCGRGRCGVRMGGLCFCQKLFAVPKWSSSSFIRPFQTSLTNFPRTPHPPQHLPVIIRPPKPLTKSTTSLNSTTKPNNNTSNTQPTKSNRIQSPSPPSPTTP